MGEDPTVRAAPAGGAVPRVVNLAVSHADQPLNRAESVVRPTDGYRPHGNPTDLVRRDMLPHISRSFEFGALRGHPHGEGRPAGEPTRIIRDGRLLVAEPGHPGERTGRVRGEGMHEAGRAHGAAGRHMATPSREGEARSELNLFEKVFMAHFEGGIPVGDKLEKGQFKFLGKSEKAWGDFFQKLLAFTMEKKGNMNNVQALVVRGILRPDGSLTQQAKALIQQAKAQGVLVSDLQFANGKTDKFARLMIQNPQVMQKIASMPPGEIIPHGLLMEWAEAFGGLEFDYQSLSHRVVNPDAVKNSESQIAEAYRTPEEMKGEAIRDGVRDSTKGIALSARTEQAVAERLDIDLKAVRSDIGLDRRSPEAMQGLAAQLGGVFSKRKKGGLLGGGLDDAAFGSGVFVPWYQHVFRPQKFKGKPRWWVPLIYFVATSTILFGILSIFRYWVNR